MEYLKILAILLIVVKKAALGSQVISPNLAPFIPQSFIPAPNTVAVSAPGVLPTSVLSTPLGPGIQAPFGAVLPYNAIVPPVPALTPSVYSPLLPAPFGLQARSIHAVAHATIPAVGPARFPAVAPALAPVPPSLVFAR